MCWASYLSIYIVQELECLEPFNVAEEQKDVRSGLTRESTILAASNRKLLVPGWFQNVTMSLGLFNVWRLILTHAISVHFTC